MEGVDTDDSEGSMSKPSWCMQLEHTTERRTVNLALDLQNNPLREGSCEHRRLRLKKNLQVFGFQALHLIAEEAFLHYNAGIEVGASAHTSSVSPLSHHLQKYSCQ